MPMRDQQAGQAVRNQHRRRLCLADGPLQCCDPVFEVRLIPTRRLKPAYRGIGCLPSGLPMRLSRTTDAGQMNEFRHASSRYDDLREDGGLRWEVELASIGKAPRIPMD